MPDLLPHSGSHHTRITEPFTNAGAGGPPAERAARDGLDNRPARDFSLDGFDQTVRLVNAVCDIARREDHHPQVMFDFKHIPVEFWPHTAGGVTRHDFICAKQLNTWMENNT
jgi:pterin-4a-carbinolamine dehydratase